jgi:hypothetical protein
MQAVIPVAADLAALEGELGANRVDEAKSKARDLEQTSSRAVVSRGCSGWPGEFNLVPTPPPPDIPKVLPLARGNCRH